MVKLRLGGGIHYWPVCMNFSYAMASSNNFMNRTWQLSLGIVFWVRLQDAASLRPWKLHSSVPDEEK